MKKIIIVCDDKHLKHGNFLAQLVSLEDDKDEKIVGTKDGAVEARVWTEKDYKANAATISSNQYILFVGNGKIAKEKRLHMDVKYSQYGMVYGWLGKQAALCVDHIVDFDDYDDFYKYAEGEEVHIEKLIEQKRLPASIDSDDYEMINQGIQDAVKKVPALGLIALKHLTKPRKIEEQQYSCLTYVFYLNGLSEFLGLE